MFLLFELWLICLCTHGGFKCWQLNVLFHVRCSTNAARRLWGTWQPSPIRFLTWIPLWRWEARVWSTQKRGRRPNCTAVPMATGWSRWAAASAVRATRRATATAKVGGSPEVMEFTEPLSSLLPRHCMLVCSCPSTTALLSAQLHLLSSSSLVHFVYAPLGYSHSFCLCLLCLLSFTHPFYFPLWLPLFSQPCRTTINPELGESCECHWGFSVISDPIFLSIVRNPLDSVVAIYLKMSFFFPAARININSKQNQIITISSDEFYINSRTVAASRKCACCQQNRLLSVKATDELLHIVFGLVSQLNYAVRRRGAC